MTEETKNPEIPCPTPEEIFKNMNPHLSDSERKKYHSDRTKMNHERMAEVASHRPTPNVEDMNPVVGGKVKAEHDEAKPEPDSESEPKNRAATAEVHDASYKTRAAKEHK